MDHKKNVVYILKCADKSLYTGWTNNLEKRLKSHRQGKASKYTRGRLPVQLVYSEVFENKVEAMKREYEIKSFSRSEKEALISSKESGDEDLN